MATAQQQTKLGRPAKLLYKPDLNYRKIDLLLITDIIYLDEMFLL